MEVIDGEVVGWVIDPASEPIGADSRRLSLLATERKCSSGQLMNDGLNDPKVSVTDEAVLSALTAQLREGGQTCQGNPLQKVEIKRAEPLGSRALRDANELDLGEFGDLLAQQLREEQ